MSVNGIKLNREQETAVEAIKAGGNVFLTGKGGTGKSVVVEAAIEALKDSGRKTVLCAPTGVAARNVGGATIHSTFRFDTAPKVADALEAVTPSKVIHQADAVIIDEIGMVRRDLMDAIARVVEKENEARRKMQGRAGMRNRLQLVVAGDFS